MVGGNSIWIWKWRRPSNAAPWQWCRVYHRSALVPAATTARRYGPLYRFDPHTPPTDAPARDPEGRTAIYIGVDLATSASEVFGETGEATLCPEYRVALIRPRAPIGVFDLTEPGAAMGIGALPSLADGPYARALTQEWARAIFEDDPTGSPLDGIRYRSAFNGGEALALWGRRGVIEVVRDSRNRPQDFPLRDPAVFPRLVTAMGARRIPVRLIESSTCRHCR
jgi:hypothetical protein